MIASHENTATGYEYPFFSDLTSSRHVCYPWRPPAQLEFIQHFRCVDTMSTPQFICDLCLKPIPASDPRLHCLDCDNIDSCANCYVQGYTTQDHTQFHRQEIIRYQGFNCPAPVLPRLFEVPLNLLSPDQSEAARCYFGDLVYPPCQPSPMLSRLASAFFDSVDGQIEPKRSGYLNPQKYYYAYHLMGAAPADNIFLQTGRFASNVLKRQFELWGIPFTLDQHTSPPTALLSKAGFTADLALDIAALPDRWHAALNGALAYLGAQESLIDPLTRLPFRYLHIPRDCFPANPDPAIKARGEEIVGTLRDEIKSGKIILREQSRQQQQPPVSGVGQNGGAQTQANLSQEAILMSSALEARRHEAAMAIINNMGGGNQRRGWHWQYG